MTRVYSIDYLRGVLAFVIMVYYFSLWQQVITPEASSFLTRFSLYGVSLFFIISGFSLTITYLSKFNDMNYHKLFIFYMKRVARIYPLFWLIIFLYLTLLYLSSKTFPNIYQIISNITLSFSFFNSYNGLTAGSWSIGIEIVFYLFFPFLLFFLNRLKVYSIFSLVIFIVVSMYISAYHMYDDMIQDEYWHIYMNLTNHIYFFLFGVLVAVIYIKRDSLFFITKRIVVFSMLITLVLILYYPVDGYVVHLLWKENRFLFSLLSFILFILVVMYNFHLNERNFLNKGLNYFGEISYTIYLLHPIVYMVFNHFLTVSAMYKITLMIISSIALSSLIHHRYEMPMQKLILTWSKNGKK